MSLSKEKNYLLYLLAKQDYSRKTLSDKLHSRANISHDEIDALLNEFESKKWLSDERFARIYIDTQINQYRGKKRIINIAVYQKGLSVELVEQVIAELQPDWFDLCQKRLHKKYKDTEILKTDFKLKQKAINHLAYNGFSFDEISECFG